MKNRLVAWLAIFMMGIALPSASQNTKFSVISEEVHIDVLVTENGKPASGLVAADFEVFDNGVRQEIQYAKLQQQTPVSATFVFDMSRSVAGRLLEHLREAAHAFLNDLNKDDQVALITFNNAVILGSSPTRDVKRVKLALDQAQPFGNSSLIDGSYAGLVLAQSSPDPPFLIIFSDGRDTFSWLTAESVLEAAKRNGAVVYAVSTARLPEKTFLRDLTKFTGGSCYEVESVEDLNRVFLDILGEFRQRYLLTYTPRAVPDGGWHVLDVRVKNRSAKVSTRPGYLRRSPPN